MRPVIKGLAAALALLLLYALAGLTCAHVAIRRERPAMPEAAELLALRAEGARPVRLSWVETASQRVLGDAIAHPVFVLEWPDGRILLVDAGMDAEAARAFGRPAELLLGAGATVVGRSIDQALGVARQRVAGVVFTHLHSDHTQGIELLCPPGAPGLDLFMTPAQHERANYTTRIGLEPIERAPCAKRVTLADEGLGRLPGLPGVGVVRAAGHTPGSQLIVAWVGGADPLGYVFAGDVAFSFSEIVDDRAKPLIYRLLITPEDGRQLGGVRRWLRALGRDRGLVVVPSHDLARIESLGLERFADREE